LDGDLRRDNENLGGVLFSDQQRSPSALTRE
jgi:hypothetical protein